MKFPQCQHAKCTEASLYYVHDVGLYVCAQHKEIQYSKDDATLLIDPSIVKTKIRVVDVCRKDFLAFAEAHERGGISAQHDDLSRLVKDELDSIFGRLETAKETKKYYMFKPLLKQVEQICDAFIEEPLYVKFAVTKAFNQSFAGAHFEDQKSAELVRIELREKYGATFERLFEKLRDQRHAVERRYEQEILDRDAKLADEETKCRTLKDTLEELKDEHKEALEELKETSENRETELNDITNELRARVQDLERTISELQQRMAAQEEEAKQKDARIHNLCGENKRQKEDLQKLGKEYEDLAEKLNEEITHSKDQQALLEKQKDSHAQSMVALKKDKDTELQALQDTLSVKDEELEKILQNHKEEVSRIIADKEKQLKKSELKKKNLQKDKDNMKKELISKLNLSKCSDLSRLYKITTGEDKQFGPETKLTLKLDNPKHMEFLTSLNKRMPDIDRLNLGNIPLNCQEVNTFLATHFPDKVRDLHFHFGSPLSSCVPFYLEELVEVSKRVTEVLYIYEFEVSQDQLVALFSANRHTKWFGFNYCKLSLSSVPDFGGTLAGSTIKCLSLYSCGDSSYGDWGNNESHFENLIAGLSKEEDFRKNLKKIRMGSCGMEKNVVDKILADYGFGHAEIIWY
ncbi:unnamed protein product [Moneuplotes crassus]|uniref:Uncharacterized protein n=1 Tax=Euplotes crassus TaxID=5936 RepID=A0AAD1U6L3_EUPCR|nr:unnamed protein product [Moneuplotes crassus]